MNILLENLITRPGMGLNCVGSCIDNVVTICNPSKCNVNVIDIGCSDHYVVVVNITVDIPSNKFVSPAVFQTVRSFGEYNTIFLSSLSKASWFNALPL